MLDKSRKIYVLDTNILIDYPNIIPGDDKKYRKPEDATIDFTGQHLVIPSAVRMELGKFKEEDSPRGAAAAVILRRLNKITGVSLRSLEQSYNLEASRNIGNDTLLTIMPVHPDFRNALPFQPSDDDQDGQIILTAIAVMHLLAYEEGRIYLDGGGIDWKDSCKRLNLMTDQVVILTNDNEMATRAHDCGISTNTYSHNIKRSYTGRRDLIVPNELIRYFWSDGEVESEVWKMYLPEEEHLVANEFITFFPDNPEDPELPQEFMSENDRFYRHIGRFDVEKGAIVRLKHVGEAPFRIKNDGQAIYAEALLEPSISVVVCTGPAGSGKTYLPTVYGLSSVARKLYGRIVVVPCTNMGTHGALPGDLDAKMALDTGPFRNAVRNYLKNELSHYQSERIRREIDALSRRTIKDLLDDAMNPDNDSANQLDEKVEALWKRHFKNIPVESARGLDFSGDLAFYDEFQDQSPAQADMLLKRLGLDGKIVITGDIKQIHARYVNETSNGITYATGLLYDQPMVARVSLLKDEIVRHPLVKAIAAKQEESHKKIS